MNQLDDLINGLTILRAFGSTEVSASCENIYVSAPDQKLNKLMQDKMEELNWSTDKEDNFVYYC